MGETLAGYYDRFSKHKWMEYFCGLIAVPILVDLLLWLLGLPPVSPCTVIVYLFASREGLPHIQVKLHGEIDSVIGKSREPSLSDKSRLPYTESVILETLRMSSFGPGAILMNNLYYVHHDPKVWGDPESFRPERFLDKAGTTVVNRELIRPFQTGRRTCTGESFERNLLFLFTVKFFQSLEVLPDPNESEPNFHPDLGLVLRVTSYKAIFKQRS